MDNENGKQVSNDLEILRKEELLVKCQELLHAKKKLETQLQEARKSNENTTKGKSGKQHKQRELDFSKYTTRRIAFRFLYLGLDYQGFAAQENTSKTIEEELFAALKKSRLIEKREGTNYSLCGRTDKGVSAFGQVIALDVRSSRLRENNDEDEMNCNIKELPYVTMLNRVLPEDIRVVAYTAVGDDFSARYSCKTRVYRYYFPRANLNIELMNEAAQKLLGEHDFRNFCKVNIGSDVNHFTRNIVSFVVRQNEHTGSPHDMCEMEIEGLAFLWHQVRCMVAVLLLVGHGLEEPSVIDFLLDVEKCPRKPQYTMAAEYPLVLYDCRFDNIEWIYEKDFNELNLKVFYQLLTKKSIQKTIIRSMTDDLASRTPLDKDPARHQISAIQPGFRVENYKHLSDRSVCHGLDRHFEIIEAKRIKLEEDLNQNQDEPAGNLNIFK